jgi:ADP-ribose pyrophosphatase YjhB (NUDIX family)
VQAYAVYYEPSGRFLLGRKLAKGYFFYKASTRKGSLVPAGKALNGGNNWALPGGRQEAQETIVDAARREFAEETAAQAVSVRTDAHQFSEEFGAAFLRGEHAVFNAVAMQIFNTNLPQGLQAKDAVAAREITKYSEIHRRFPSSPQDNELGDAHVWDVNDADDWSVIEQWKDDPVIGWYYRILFYLKHSIL